MQPPFHILRGKFDSYIDWLKSNLDVRIAIAGYVDMGTGTSN